MALWPDTVGYPSGSFWIIRVRCGKKNQPSGEESPAETFTFSRQVFVEGKLLPQRIPPRKTFVEEDLFTAKKLVQLPPVDMQKLPGSFCCYSNHAPRANMWSLNGSLALACCMSTAGSLASFFSVLWLFPGFFFFFHVAFFHFFFHIVFFSCFSLSGFCSHFYSCIFFPNQNTHHEIPGQPPIINSTLPAQKEHPTSFTKQDFSYFSSGASILDPLTPPTWSYFHQSQTTKLLFYGDSQIITGSPPFTVLMSNIRIGKCWSFHGTMGKVVIQISQTVWITGCPMRRALYYLKVSIGLKVQKMFKNSQIHKTNHSSFHKCLSN
ncbi:uncharacterized protein VP01_3252g2 [Puccinia sorghi]|uniref:Uncharacterized protein n=1 Tax=Puccinia sorghi TaxID=27349 RepID=A0A0L6UXZ0_9BASI|nr:uncharacterized protein VP01_3252g2 [Puccinia sorghi]